MKPKAFMALGVIGGCLTGQQSIPERPPVVMVEVVATPTPTRSPSPTPTPCRSDKKQKDDIESNNDMLRSQLQELQILLKSLSVTASDARRRPR